MKKAFSDYLAYLDETKIDFHFQRSVELNSLFYKKLPVITVCGTNGKGSTCMFLEKILTESEYKVGTTVSPHVENALERIRINGQEISVDTANEFTISFRDQIENRKITPTYFEFLTFLALHIFEETSMDIGIFETGLGGRLDSTHAIPRKGAILTSVSMDHMAYLGNTLKSIASEKIPILEESPFSVVSQQQSDVESVIHERLKKPFKMEGRDFHHSGVGNMFVYESGDLRIGPVNLGIPGDHQASNAASAVTMALHLKENGWDQITLQTIQTGLEKASNIARLEKWKNTADQEIWLDVAHNEDAIAKQVQFFYVRNYHDFHTVFGCSRDKESRDMIEPLRAISTEFHFVSTPSSRSWKPENIELQDPVVCVRQLIQLNTKSTLCTGSFYHVGEIRKYLPQWGFSRT